MTTGITASLNGSATRPIRTLAILSLLVTALWSLDWFLEKTEREEVQSEAQRRYKEGIELLNQGKLSPAVDTLRRAHALARTNLDYELALTGALIASGKTDDANTLLDEVLQHAPNNGRANLTAARLMVAKRRLTEAEAYYHRAIFGEWPSEAAKSRRAARIELIDLLIKSGRKEELLAELLPLEEEANGDLTLKERIPHLLVAAGSPLRAIDAYRSLIDQNPKDADLYTGLGEAQLAQGDYRAAVSAFVAAYRNRPGDASIRQRMEFSSLMAGLDPTPRRLPSREKYDRSVHLLDLARSAFEKCLASHAMTFSPDEPPTPRKPALHVTNELAEEKLAQAEEIWRARVQTCGETTSSEEEPLRLIMTKLAR